MRQFGRHSEACFATAQWVPGDNIEQEVVSDSDGRIFFPDKASAEAAFEQRRAKQPVSHNGGPMLMTWRFNDDKAMTMNGHTKGMAFTSQPYGFTHKGSTPPAFGAIYVHFPTVMHARVALIPGSSHNAQSRGWSDSKSFEAELLYRHLNRVWEELTDHDRLLRLCADRLH